MAVNTNNSYIVTKLIEAGADVNTFNKKVSDNG
jgi:hypothetical protein